MDEKERLNGITKEIIGAGIEVHRELGPGLLESAYEACLAFELEERGLKVERQKPMPLVYKGIYLDCGYRLDLLVEDSVIIELKAAEKLTDLNEAQLLSYLRLAKCHVGLLINFNVQVLKQGIRRLVHNFPSSSSSPPSSPPSSPRSLRPLR
jgi:GxxExxY protein